MSKALISFLTLTFMFGFASLTLAPSLVSAQSGQADTLEDLIGSQMGDIRNVYGDQGENPGALPRAIADIINIALGFVGIIFLALFVYAGLLWMTAAGNETRIETAKKVMTAAVIGVVIVLSAYAITHFVIPQIIRATGGK